MTTFADDLSRFRHLEPKFFLGPRPGKKTVRTLADLNLTHCCTLLNQRENARSIEKIAQQLGCTWVWLPFEGGRLEILRETDLLAHVWKLMRAVGDQQQPRIYFHCSAGIHRTGFFVYVLLRLFGLDRTAALAELAKLRAVTAEQVGDERIDLADELLARGLAD